MKRLLLLMMMSYSGYSFCGEVGWASVTLNGYIVAYAVGGGGQPPSGSLIDSNYFYRGDDTINANGGLLGYSGGGDGTAYITYIGNGDTISYSDSAYPFIYRTGKYYIDISACQYDLCDISFILNFVFTGATGITTITNEPSQIEVLSNPVSSTLKLNSQQTINHINIYDELGRLRLSPQITSSQDIYEAGINELAKGVYVVEVLSGIDEKDYIKIVKQ